MEVATFVSVDIARQQLRERIRVINRLHGRYSDNDDFVIYMIEQKNLIENDGEWFIEIDTQSIGESNGAPHWMVFLLKRKSYLISRAVFDLLPRILVHMVHMTPSLLIVVSHSTTGDDHFSVDYRIDLNQIAKENTRLKADLRDYEAMLSRKRSRSKAKTHELKLVDTPDQLRICIDCDRELLGTSFRETVYTRNNEGVVDDALTRIRYRNRCHTCRSRRGKKSKIEDK